MPGPLRRLFNIPHLKCSLCTRRFRKAAGLANHFNAAHARAEGHNVSAVTNNPDNGLHGDEFNLPQDDNEEIAAEELPSSYREYHPVLDGELPRPSGTPNSNLSQVHRVMEMAMICLWVLPQAPLIYLSRETGLHMIAVSSLSWRTSFLEGTRCQMETSPS